MTEQEMIEKQWELARLIQRMEVIFIGHQFNKYEQNEEIRLNKSNKVHEENLQLLAAIKMLIEEGVDLNFKNKSVMERAVATDSIELIQMFLSAGLPINEVNGKGLLYHAAEKGAAQIVRFLIEEKGVNPRRRSQRDFSVLAAARSSRYSREVLPYLMDVMGKTKSERMPVPKKLHELTEENMLKYLPQVSISANQQQKLHNIIESLFIEEYSVKLANFYEIIAVQDPELVFACISLITNAITKAPAQKTVKSIAAEHYVHHGNLEVTGSLKIRSLMVTGNCTVKGHASNVQGCQLFVGGDFECASMYTEGPVIIGGNLKAAKVETYYNDYALEVKQTLQTDTLIIDHHQVIAGQFDVKERIEK
ncbi:ankyrin repeat domain-containing protein [Chitinophaga pinensis]|uniref:Ankyrin repeat domain-containing protein n=1 Tax=Chitinophaga pinensis (strain ATCC 43595 / DSM 2588 / LMG 13176 / NBRC 15968 / NCIMB 11800 / UQM 2034) TaxID=485918 RepID=A0A979G7C5_CHIPD|nr:ankyrin repeat domain-containing protein [Chitinophaga pinensis]ACU62067.1 conserved hypothetical protein [Chitinophaga pinensis DSM 2588]